MEIQSVHLNRQSCDTLVFSALELYPCEPRGIVSGYLESGTFHGLNANTLLNTTRKEGEVRYLRDAPLKRARAWINLMKACNNRSYQFMAGYHVHPYAKGDTIRNLSYLSKDDRDAECIIWGDAEAFNQNQALELIVRIKKEEDGPEEPHYEIKHYRKRVGVNICIDDEEYYRLMLSAFLLTKKDNSKNKLLNVRELKLTVNGYSK